MNSRQGSWVHMILNMDQGSKTRLSDPLFSHCFYSATSFQSSSFQSNMHKDLCPYTCVMVGQINLPLAALSPLQINCHKRLKYWQVKIIWSTKGLFFPYGMYLQSLIWSSDKLPSSNKSSVANGSCSGPHLTNANGLGIFRLEPWVKLLRAPDSWRVSVYAEEIHFPLENNFHHFWKRPREDAQLLLYSLS